MLLIMAVVTLMIFAIFDSDKFKKQIAVAELGGFAVSALSDQDYGAWLDRKGLNVPWFRRSCNTLSQKTIDATAGLAPLRLAGERRVPSTATTSRRRGRSGSGRR